MTVGSSWLGGDHDFRGKSAERTQFLDLGFRSQNILGQGFAAFFGSVPGREWRRTNPIRDSRGRRNPPPHTLWRGVKNRRTKPIRDSKSRRNPRLRNGLLRLASQPAAPNEPNREGRSARAPSDCVARGFDGRAVPSRRADAWRGARREPRPPESDPPERAPRNRSPI